MIKRQILINKINLSNKSIKYVQIMIMINNKIILIINKNNHKNSNNKMITKIKLNKLKRINRFKYQIYL